MIYADPITMDVLFINFRDFRLILTPKRGLLHHQFEATSIDAEGNETPVAVGMFKLNKYYKTGFNCHFLITEIFGSNNLFIKPLSKVFVLFMLDFNKI